MAERDEPFAELPLDTVGARLRRARESAGLSLRDIAASTKIAERHLSTIEADDFGSMASRAYALGFSRSYARAVGLDDKEIVNEVRQVMDGLEARVDHRPAATFEPGDPARVPDSRTAWIAALAALALIVAGFLLWRSFYVPAVSLPDLTSDQPAPSATASQIAAGGVPQSAQGPVTFTALEQGVWVKFYDAAGTQLLQKQLAMGESYTVPANAAGPMLWTARPQALQVAIGGQVVAKLSDRQVTMKDVPVTAAALLARPPAAAPPPSGPAVMPQAYAAGAGTSPRSTAAARPAATARPQPAAATAPLPAGPADEPAPLPQSSTVSQ